MPRKILVLDTSAVISLVQNITTSIENNTPGFAGVLGDNEVIIPRMVLVELDKLKREGGDRAKVCNEAAKQLESYGKLGSLLEGVETEKGGILRFYPSCSDEKIKSWGLNPKVPDHQILATTIDVEDSCQNDSEGKREVILITQDRLLRVLANSYYDVRAEELKSIWAPLVKYELGCHEVGVSSKEFDEVLSSAKYHPEHLTSLNDFYHIVDNDNPELRHCYGMLKKDHRAEAGASVDIIDRGSVDYLQVAGGVKGKNLRQKLLLWSLMGCGEPDPMADDGVRLITVSGPAGSGKSFLTLAAAWERLERGHFERIVVTRPMVEVGTSLGYLPGSLDEKVAPWGGFIEDNLRAIVQVPTDEESQGMPNRRGLQHEKRTLDAKAWLEMENRLELIPLTHLRGRTFRKTFVILEEAQNIERGPLKVLLTRLGEGSVVVVVGDLSQVDNPFLSGRNNGLIHAINAFKNWPQSIHISLQSVVRSDLAKAAGELL